MRIVSFLPAGTEIAWAVGAGESLVGRSHECDFPPRVKALPVVSRPTLQLDGLSTDEIDRAIAARIGGGGSLYEIDEALLRDLQPDLILTQDLCQVCAPSGNELSRALRDLPRRPEVVWLTPHTIAEIERDIFAVGAATGNDRAAAGVVAAMHERIAGVAARVKGSAPRRVAFLEWVDPPFGAGHWVGEMIVHAGGEDPLASPGKDSRRLDYDDIRARRPEVVVVAPCGYGVEHSARLARAIRDFDGARVFAVDANAYFARPGPRVAEGIELLAALFHPDRVQSPLTEHAAVEV